MNVEPGPNKRLAWRAAFGGTLLLGMAVATYMTFILGVLAPFLIKDFGISRFQLGSLTTMLYLVGGFGSPTAGRVVDRLGGRLTLEWLFLAGALGVLSLALARNYLWLVIAMLISGVALAAGNPATNKLVAEHLQVGTRGPIMGIKQAGVPMGTLLVGVVLPGASLLLGWRWAVILALTLPIVGILLGRVLLPPDPTPVRSTSAKRRAPLGSAVAWLTPYAFFMGTGVAVVNVYLPLYAFDRVGMSVTTAGLVASFIGFIGVFSRVAWGRIAERVTSVTVPLLVIGLSSTASALLIMLATDHGAWMLWMAAFIFGATTLGWIVVGMLGIVESAGLDHAGRASGRILLGFYGGFISSPVLFGAIVDKTDSFRLGWGLTACAFGSATVIALAWARTTRRDAAPSSSALGD